MNNKKEAMGAVTAFRRLYARAAAEGRGEVLFGADAAEKSVSVLEKYAVVGTTKAIFCFEFPFIGKPYMDLLIGCEAGDISPPVTFAKEPDPVIRRFFDACAGEQPPPVFMCCRPWNSPRKIMCRLCSKPQAAKTVSSR